MCHSAHILRDIDLQNLQTADGADGWSFTAQCGYVLTADWKVMNDGVGRSEGWKLLLVLATETKDWFQWLGHFRVLSWRYMAGGHWWSHQHIRDRVTAFKPRDFTSLRLVGGSDWGILAACVVSFCKWENLSECVQLRPLIMWARVWHQQGPRGKESHWNKLFLLFVLVTKHVRWCWCWCWCGAGAIVL